MTSIGVCMCAAILASFSLSSTQAQSETALHCSAVPITVPMKVLVDGRRNQTGHWISKVTVGHVEHPRGIQEVKMSDAWHVDVEHSTTSCQGGATSSNIILTFTAPPTPSPGYDLIPGMGYYKFHTVAQNWNLAREACIEERAHLMIINSEKEADVVKKLFSSNPQTTGSEDGNWIWTGIYEEGTNGNYLTVLGEKASLATIGYMRWQAGRPALNTIGECVLALGSSAVYHDNPCTRKMCFICEQELY